MSEERPNPLAEAREAVKALRAAAPVELQTALDDLGRTLEAAARRGEGEDAETLRQRMDALIQENARFASLMVHEIRIPMTSIKGYSDMLAKNIAGELNEMQAQFVETIRANVSRMEQLVSDISDMSKLRSGRLRLEPKMDLYKNIAMQVEKAAAPLAAEHGHTLVFETPASLPLLNLDGERLAQALTKLVVNALRYTPDGGTITVRAEGVDGKLRVSVIDTGIGLSEEEQGHVGELFWRGESEHVRSFKGHGLGLPIAKGLIELMGGEFFFSSTAGQGSTFGFVVPGMA
ncbi:MAG: HAMP domain-containing sensor histidine kinase [Chloroflexota bacterium]